MLNHAFELRNEGDEGLVLEAIQNSCGCTAASLTLHGRTLTKEELAAARPIGVLAPGETAALQVELRTSRVPEQGRELRLHKTLRVRSNDAAHDPLTITLRATISAPYSIEPKTIDFGELRKGSTAHATALLRSDQLGEFLVTGAVAGAPESMRVSATRVADAPGLAPGWLVAVDVLPDAPLGTVETHAALTLDHPRIRELLVPVRFVIVPNVEFDDGRPDRIALLDFGRVDPASGATSELGIVNHRPEVPYVPTRVALGDCRPADLRFETELVELDPGVRYAVRLTAPARHGPAAFFQGQLIVTADHPEVPRKVIEFRGWYSAQ